MSYTFLRKQELRHYTREYQIRVTIIRYYLGLLTPENALKIYTILYHLDQEADFYKACAQECKRYLEILSRP